MAMITIKKFSRPGCVPCQIISNCFTEIDLGALNAELIELNTNDLTDEELNPYKLSGVPTMIFYRNGLEVHRLVGRQSVEEIIDAIEHAKVVR